MNPRRFATVAPALCGAVGLAAWIVAWLAGYGSAGINTGTVPIDDRAASLAANARPADEPQAIAMGNAVVATTVVAKTVVANTAVASSGLSVCMCTFSVVASPTTRTESPSSSSGVMKRPELSPTPVTAKFVQKR